LFPSFHVNPFPFLTGANPTLLPQCPIRLWGHPPPPPLAFFQRSWTSCFVGFFFFFLVWHVVCAGSCGFLMRWNAFCVQGSISGDHLLSPLWVSFPFTRMMSWFFFYCADAIWFPTLFPPPPFWRNGVFTAAVPPLSSTAHGFPCFLRVLRRLRMIFFNFWDSSPSVFSFFFSYGLVMDPSASTPASDSFFLVFFFRLRSVLCVIWLFFFPPPFPPPFGVAFDSLWFLGKKSFLRPLFIVLIQFAF